MKEENNNSNIKIINIPDKKTPDKSNTTAIVYLFEEDKKHRTKKYIKDKSVAYSLMFLSFVIFWILRLVNIPDEARTILYILYVLFFELFSFGFFTTLQVDRNTIYYRCESCMNHYTVDDFSTVRGCVLGPYNVTKCPHCGKLQIAKKQIADIVVRIKTPIKINDVKVETAETKEPQK